MSELQASESCKEGMGEQQLFSSPIKHTGRCQGAWSLQSHADTALAGDYRTQNGRGFVENNGNAGVLSQAAFHAVSIDKGTM
jgi:hypothetical protein